MMATMSLNGQPTYVMPSVTYIEPKPTQLDLNPADSSTNDPVESDEGDSTVLASNFITKATLNP